MTREEFDAKRADIKARRKKLDEEEDWIRRKYIEANSDASLIDKRVKVVSKNRHNELITSIVWLGGYEIACCGNIVPVFYKDKKTGGRSLQRSYIYSTIVSIEEYKED